MNVTESEFVIAHRNYPWAYGIRPTLLGLAINYAIKYNM